MEDVLKIGAAFLAGIVTIAIVSEFVGKKSQAPQAIQAVASSVANVVSAAVNPVTQAYGFGNGQQTATSPTMYKTSFGSSNFSGILSPFGGSNQ